MRALQLFLFRGIVAAFQRGSFITLQVILEESDARNPINGNYNSKSGTIFDGLL